MNKTINGYSEILGIATDDFIFCDSSGAQGTKTKAPTVNKKTSINCVTDVTWNKPLYNPKPEPIACTYRLFKDSAALKSKMIEVIRVNKLGVNEE